MILILRMTADHGGPPEERRLEQGTLTIGRGADNDWVLTDPERTLSKLHCRIDQSGDGFLLTDLSTNGVFVNDEPRALGRGRSHGLSNGDTIVLGPFHLTASIAAPSSRALLPAAHDPVEPRPKPGPAQLDFNPFTGHQHTPGSPITPANEPWLEQIPGGDFGPGLHVRPHGWDTPIDPADFSAHEPRAADHPLDPAPMDFSHDNEHVAAISTVMKLPAAQSVLPTDWNDIDPLAGAELAPMPFDAPNRPPAKPDPSTIAIPNEDLLAALDQAPEPSPAPDETDAIPIIDVVPVPILPVPTLPVPVPPVPVVPNPVAPTPIAPTPVAPTPVAPDPVTPAYARAVHTIDAAPLSLEPIDESELVSAQAYAPPPAKPASRPADPIPPATTNAEILAAFLDGAGLPANTLGGMRPEDTARDLGRLVRAAVEGAREILATRAMVKSELRVDQTIIQATGNNAMKFAPDVQRCLAAMVGQPPPGFLPGSAAMAQGMDDIKRHELALIASLNSVFTALSERLDPDGIAAKARAENSLNTILPYAREARCWAIYLENYQALQSTDAENTAGSLLAPLAAAYARQLKRSE